MSKVHKIKCFLGLHDEQKIEGIFEYQKGKREIMFFDGILIICCRCQKELKFIFKLK